MEVDINAVIQGTGLAIDLWTKRKMGGVIINTASQGGLIEMPFSPIYCAAKHAVVGFTRSCV
jgi:short-subunit dehydrogenase